MIEWLEIRLPLGLWLGLGFSGIYSALLRTTSSAHYSYVKAVRDP